MQRPQRASPMSQSSSSAEPQQLVHVSGAQLCMCGGGSGDVLPWKMPLDCLDRVASRACVAGQSRLPPRPRGPHRSTSTLCTPAVTAGTASLQNARMSKFSHRGWTRPPGPAVCWLCSFPNADDATSQEKTPKHPRLEPRGAGTMAPPRRGHTPTAAAGKFAGGRAG